MTQNCKSLGEQFDSMIDSEVVEWCAKWMGEDICFCSSQFHDGSGYCTACTKFIRKPKDYLNDRNHLWQVEEKIIEDEELFKKFSNEIWSYKEVVSGLGIYAYMKSTPRKRLRALYIAINS